MIYNIYKNIDEKSYDAFEIEINKLNLIIIEYIQQFFFYSERKRNPDELGFSYKKYPDDFKGGIGFSFDDLPGKLTFSLNLIKAYDVKEGRYYHGETAVKSFDLNDLTNNYKEWFKKAIERYNSLRKEDLTDYVEFTKY